MKEYVDFIKKCGEFFVNTVSKNTPQSRPFGVISYDGQYLYLATSKGKKVYTEMLDNPNVQITAVMHGTMNWVRFSGVVSEEKSFEKKVLMFNDNPVLNNIYETVHNPKFVLFKFDVRSKERY